MTASPEPVVTDNTVLSGTRAWSAGSTTTMGTAISYSSAATMAPSTMMASGWDKMMAAGAAPDLISSAKTLELELEPRPEDMRRTFPAKASPNWGWWGSTTSPASSTPPQKDRGSERRMDGATARPPEMAVPSIMMRPLVRESCSEVQLGRAWPNLRIPRLNRQLRQHRYSMGHSVPTFPNLS